MTSCAGKAGEGGERGRRNGVTTDFSYNVVSGHSELYTYDGLNRLATMSRGTLSGDGTSITDPSASQSWNLNALGDWNSSTTDGTTTTRTNNAQNQATVVAGNALSYDANGNTLVDQNGQHYTFDAWNRLVKVANSSGTTIANYTYDPAGRRVTQTEGGVTTDLYYSTAGTGQVVEERQGGTTTTQNVWSPFYVNQLIERDDQPNGSGQLTRRLYVEQDANYNVTSLTDASGNVVQRFVYSAYGVATVETASGVATPDAYNWLYTFQGGRFDPATGLIHFGAREYSPTLGRWMQQDPAMYLDGLSRYQAELSNPIINVDPKGLKAFIPPAATIVDAPVEYEGLGLGNVSAQIGATCTEAFIWPLRIADHILGRETGECHPILGDLGSTTVWSQVQQTCNQGFHLIGADLKEAWDEGMYFPPPSK